MELGLHISNFSWPDGPDKIADNITRVAVLAEDVGFGRLSVMDHLWQVPFLGAQPEEPVLEAYTTLGYLAARTSRIELLAWVTAVTYRDPGLLVKAVTSVDVLSGGRAMLGIGAGFYGDEAAGLGLFLPPTGERLERLEEALQIFGRMWAPDDGPYEGKHYRLGRALNSPQPLRRPRPPILIAGGGEKKTLRLVARYADACNLIAGEGSLERKLDVLRGHCADIGRDYAEIEKTLITSLDPGPDGERVDALLDELRGYAALGFTQVQGAPNGPVTSRSLQILGERVIPQVARF